MRGMKRRDGEWASRRFYFARAARFGVRRLDAAFNGGFLLLLASTLVICLSVTALAQDDEEEETSNAKPDAGGIVIEPSSGKISEGITITITFPVSMVAADLIDVGNQQTPFVSEPKLDGTFLWKSQTEGIFTVSGVVAGARHRLTLAPGLKDATGKPFVAKDWSAEFRTPKFAISSVRAEKPYAPADTPCGLLIQCGSLNPSGSKSLGLKYSSTVMPVTF